MNLLKYFLYFFPKSISYKKYIFIVSLPRSGSTLLKAILCSNPNLYSTGHDISNIFKFHTVRSFKKRFPFLYIKEITRKDIINMYYESKDIVQFYDMFTKRILESYGGEGEKFVDKIIPYSPKVSYLGSIEYKFFIRLVLKNFIAAKVIFLFRDPRDGYCSALKTNLGRFVNIENWALSFKNFVNSMLELKNNPRIFNMKYEDLVINKDKIVNELFKFIGEEYSPAFMKKDIYSKNIEVSLAPTFHKNIGKEIFVNSIGRWKVELKKREVERFVSIAKRQLVWLGYSLH